MFVILTRFRILRNDGGGEKIVEQKKFAFAVKVELRRNEKRVRNFDAFQITLKRRNKQTVEERKFALAVSEWNLGETRGMFVTWTHLAKKRRKEKDCCCDYIIL